MTVRAAAPGRVNLIGDHVDYVGGLVLPLAIDRSTTVVGTGGGDSVALWSDDDPDPAIVPLDLADPAAVEPAWARYVAGVVTRLRPSAGFSGTVRSTIPLGAGLSSSAALEVAVALALGADPSDAVAVAELCRDAEQSATGVPCGIMDQLAITAGVRDHALLIDCRARSWDPVPIPPGVDIVIVHSGEPRALSDTAYAERRAQCEAAEAAIGPLRDATPDDVRRIDDAVVERRARHVVTEIARVRAAAEALGRGDLAAIGAAMWESHASLRDDYDVSTPALDALVDRLATTAGVHGARLTGAGFGGCVVALAEPGALSEGWVVRASGGASVSAT